MGDYPKENKYSGDLFKENLLGNKNLRNSSLKKLGKKEALVGKKCLKKNEELYRLLYLKGNIPKSPGIYGRDMKLPKL